MKHYWVTLGHIYILSPNRGAYHGELCKFSGVPNDVPSVMKNGV